MLSRSGITSSLILFKTILGSSGRFIINDKGDTGSDEGKKMLMGMGEVQTDEEGSGDKGESR
jgi:hypothetical protein